MKVTPPPPDNKEPVSRPALLRLQQVWIYALEKPVVFSVMFYGYVSIVGLIYNAAYFDRFGISILEFYEMQDFLLGGLRNPAILLMTFLFITVMVFMEILGSASARANRRSRQEFVAILAKGAAEGPSALAWGLRFFLPYFKLREYVDEKIRWFDRFRIPALAIVVTFLSVSLIVTIATATANPNSLSDRSRYCIYLTEGLMSNSPLVLIGTSQGFYFLRGLGTLEVEVIPRKEVLRMTKIGTSSTVCIDHKAASPPLL